jgi:hypothetical protein
MKKDYTKIVFVVDRSGSMSKIAADIIGGYNGFIKEQKALNHGSCDVSFYQFDDVYESVYENRVLNEVKDLDDKTYVPRNMTALYDAIGKTINRLGETLKNLNESERPEKILFVVITDGLENSSSEFTSQQINKMIKHQTEKYNWQFSYIGANQDAWAVGGSLGFAEKDTITWASNKGGTEKLWNSLTRNVADYRTKSCYAFSAADIKDQEDEGAVVKTVTTTTFKTV